MTDSRKNAILLLAVLIAFASLPMTWFQAEVSSNDLFNGSTFYFNGFSARIQLLGGLPTWWTIVFVIVAALAQILSKFPSFDVPHVVLWAFAGIGFFVVSIPIITCVSSGGKLIPYAGWFLALLSSFIPLATLAVPSKLDGNVNA